MDWPKCEVCGGSGEIYQGGPEVKDPCSKCNGTGERDLTADEAAEYISQSYYMGGQITTWYIWYFKCKERQHWNFEFYTEDETCCDMSFQGITDPKAITEALNSACRAVRSKGCE